MNLEYVLYAANESGVTALSAMRSGDQIMFWVAPKSSAQRFWELLEKAARRDLPLPLRHPAPTYYVFTDASVPGAHYPADNPCIELGSE
jgi:hypothetical protein